MKRLLLGIILLSGLISCTSNTTTSTIGVTTEEPAEISGTINWTYTGSDIDVTSKAPIVTNRSLPLSNNSSVSLKFS